MDANDLQNNPLLFDEAGCANSEPFALRVLGDSMEPEFPDGCIVIIEPNAPAQDGSYVMAELPDQGFIFRQLAIEDGNVWLKPLNEGYEAIEVSDVSCIKGLVIQRGSAKQSDYKKYC